MRFRLIVCCILASLLSFAQSTDASGKKQGYWKKKDPASGKLIYEGQFVDDKPTGRFRYYYPNDTVRAIMHFRKDGKTAYAWLFHPSGKRMAEGKYVNREVRDSIWTFYDESGTLLSKETYLRGKKEGPAYVYLPDGNLSEEKHFSNDLQNGPFRQYFDGKLIRSQGRYKLGKMDGRVSYHYPNGVEAAAGFYRNGLRTGPWIYKTEKGDVKSRELYKNGELASEKETKEFFEKSAAHKPAASSQGGSKK